MPELRLCWYAREYNQVVFTFFYSHLAHQLKLSDSQMTLTGEKGYCMCRATHSVHTGTYFFEATIIDQPENSATRIGWSQLIGESVYPPHTYCFPPNYRPVLSGYLSEVHRKPSAFPMRCIEPALPTFLKHGVSPGPQCWRQSSGRRRSCSESTNPVSVTTPCAQQPQHPLPPRLDFP